MPITTTPGAGIIAFYKDRNAVIDQIPDKLPGQEIFNSGLHGSYIIIPQKDFYAKVDMWGAAGGGSHGGGGSHAYAGAGGFTTGTVLFQKGVQHTIWVGEGGKCFRGQTVAPFGGGGYAHSGGEGGGLSGLFIDNKVNRDGALLIAGGGGGGGHGGNNHHGGGGGGGGLSGNNAHNCGGGSQTGGGGGGYNSARGGHGVFQGGRSGINHSHTGGGGGGWFGGGGSGHTGPNHYNGGAGGSGHYVGAPGTNGFGNYRYVSLVTGASTSTAGQANNSGDSGNPANSSDPRRQNAGQSFVSSTPGNDGRVIITMVR